MYSVIENTIAAIAGNGLNSPVTLMRRNVSAAKRHPDGRVEPDPRRHDSRLGQRPRNRRVFSATVLLHTTLAAKRATSSTTPTSTTIVMSSPAAAIERSDSAPSMRFVVRMATNAIATVHSTIANRAAIHAMLTTRSGRRTGASKRTGFSYPGLAPGMGSTGSTWGDGIALAATNAASTSSGERDGSRGAECSC